MVSDGLLKRADGVIPHFYHLKSHKKAYNIFNYQHEKIIGDIYVALSDLIKYWSRIYYEDFLSVGLKPDVSTNISDLIIFWEIDRSTMTISKIIGKLKKYVKLAKRDGRSFTVVFACSNRRAKSILNNLQGFKNPLVRFYTVDYKELISNPTGQIFNSPTLERVTLLYR